MSPTRKSTRSLLLLTRSNGFRINRIQSTLSRDLEHLFSDTAPALDTGKLPGDDKAKHEALQLWRNAEDVLRRDVLREFVKKLVDAAAFWKWMSKETQNIARDHGDHNPERRTSARMQTRVSMQAHEQSNLSGGSTFG
ncbi:hypothetical protein EDB87DRAFT_1576675 [Lactarius vividus]|nr:hypothetical protein EDB87DRAFT_1576675 [Lactarius vividus]